MGAALGDAPLSDAALAELAVLCPGTIVMREGGHTYVHLPALRLPAGCQPPVVDALLCLQPHQGYTTRLFLAAPIAGRGQNWTVHRILDRTWHTWSWQGVPADVRPMEVLAGHLRGLR